MVTALPHTEDSLRVEAALSEREVAEGTPSNIPTHLPATPVVTTKYNHLNPVWVESEINILRKQWFDYAKVLLGPIPSKLPRFREVNHEINLIDDAL